MSASELLAGERTRGERNNNPGNIERSSAPWGGKVLGLDSRFECFDCPENGIRALGKILLTYQRRHKLRTIEDIIGRWAPPSENDTDAYVRSVASALGTPQDVLLDLENETTLAALVRAIIHHENGRVSYSQAVIDEGVERALA